MDGATSTKLGVRAGEMFDLPDGYRVEVQAVVFNQRRQESSAVFLVTHASGRKVFSRLVKAGHFKLSLNGPEPLPGDVCERL